MKKIDKKLVAIVSLYSSSILIAAIATYGNISISFVIAVIFISAILIVIAGTVFRSWEKGHKNGGLVFWIVLMTVSIILISGIVK